MSGDPWANPWARHYQTFWQEKAANPDLPAWLRIVCLAYGSHRVNGHAVFSRGDLAIALGQIDRATGEFHPAFRQNVQRAITAAVKGGWLDERSTARCLVVPAHAIQGGSKGNPADECPLHNRRKVETKPARPILRVVGE